MSMHAIVMLAIKVSLALLVIAIGLQSTMRDATVLLRRPGLLARSFLAMNVVMPLLAIGLATSFALTPVVSLALVALMLSPVPPSFPIKAASAGGDASYVVGLLVMASLASIVSMPLSVALLGTARSTPLHISPVTILKLVGTSVLVPLFIGLALRAIAPGARRFGKPVALAAIVVLVVAMILIVRETWPAMRSLIGNGTLAAIVGMTLLGLGAGHLLGGPDPGERTVLALATAARHPSVAIAVLTANFPNEQYTIPAVVLALIVGMVAGVPYILWRKRRSAQRRAALLPAQAG